MACNDKRPYRFVAEHWVEDFELAPFYERGGAVRAYQLFGKGLNNILEELNEVLAA